MTAEVSGPRDRAERDRTERDRTDVVSAWSRQHRQPASVAIGAFGFSRRQWIVAIVLIVVAVIDVTRGYALVMSSVNTMQHSGESSNIRSVIGQQPATTSVSAKK